MPDQPDMIAQAGELIKLLQQGQKIAVASSPFDTADRAIVIASAALAIAAEIRDLRNVLAMAMSEGSDANGSPISALRIDTGA